MDPLTEYMGFGLAFSAAEPEQDIYDRLDDIKNRLPNVDTFEELDSYQRFIDSSITELLRDEVQQYERLPQVVQEARRMAEEFVENRRLPRFGYIPRDLVYALTDIVNLQQAGARVQAKREELDTRRRREEAQPAIEEGLTRGRLYEPGLTDIVNSYIGNGNVFSNRRDEDDFFDSIMQDDEELSNQIDTVEESIPSLESLDEIEDYTEILDVMSSNVEDRLYRYSRFPDLVIPINNTAFVMMSGDRDNEPRIIDTELEILIDHALEMPRLLRIYPEEQIPAVVFDILGAEMSKLKIEKLYEMIEDQKKNVITNVRREVQRGVYQNLSPDYYEQGITDMINSYNV